MLSRRRLLKFLAATPVAALIPNVVKASTDFLYYKPETAYARVGLPIVSCDEVSETFSEGRYSYYATCNHPMVNQDCLLKVFADGEKIYDRDLGFSHPSYNAETGRFEDYSLDKHGNRFPMLYADIEIEKPA